MSEESGGRDAGAKGPLAEIASLLAIVGGAAAVLFAAGGAVLAGRLLAYRIPSELVVGQLPREYLLAVGLSEVAMPALLTALLYLFARGMLWHIIHDKIDSQNWRWAQFVAMSLGVAILVGTGRQWVHGISTPWISDDKVFSAMHIFIGAVAVALSVFVTWGTAYLLKIKGTVSDSSVLRSLDLRMAAAIAIGVVPVWVYNGATAPLLEAVVCPKVTTESTSPGQAPAPAYLVGTGERLYLAYPVTAVPTPRYVSSIPLDDATLRIWNPEVDRSGQPQCPALAPLPSPGQTQPSPIPSVGNNGRT